MLENDLPDYSAVAGESTLGALVIGEEPLRIILAHTAADVKRRAQRGNRP